MLSLWLLSQKAQLRDSDPADTTAVLANFLKALYFRRWKTWMLHTLYIDSSCYEVSICHMTIVLDLIFMIKWLLEKKLKFFVMLISLLLWVIELLHLVCVTLQGAHARQTVFNWPQPHFMDQWTRLSFGGQVHISDTINNQSSIFGVWKHWQVSSDLDVIFMVQWRYVSFYTAEKNILGSYNGMMLSSEDKFGFWIIPLV